MDLPDHQPPRRKCHRAHARLAQVQALVWAPLAAELQGVARVLLVPHAELGGLPFAALPVPVAGDASGATQPLGRQLQLALAASARAAWRGLQRPPRPARRLLALAESSRLPHAAAEARAVAALFTDASALIDAQASLPALRREAPAADVLHLACHAQFRGDNPRFSALHLHDGALTVEAAEALALPACTVVLSACDTGTAEIARGDEQVGLVRAFMVAGAARVLASQWPVDDAVTAQFMAVFHAALAAGQAPAAALQAAQERSRADHPHPAHWAAFALHGGW